ncbi:MAG: adenylate/guanylate cyclase domain-containing protein [Aureliella sp.]
MNLYYQVLRNAQLLAQGEITPPFQIGRQNEAERELTPVCISQPAVGPRRLVIASISSDLGVPRNALSVRAADGAEFIVEKSLTTSKEHDTRPSDQRVLPACGRSLLVRHIGAGDQLAVKEEIALVFDGGLLVRLSARPGGYAEGLHPHSEPAAAGETFQSLASLKDHAAEAVSQGSILDLPSDAQQEAVALVSSALRAFNQIPGSPEFFATVVSSVKEMIDVDRVLLLMRSDGGWLEKATSDDTPAPPVPAVISRSLVQRVLQTRQTEIVESVVAPSMLAVSMRDIQRAVAAPIFDERREIVAILYADKHLGGASDRPISLLQASLLEVIASAVSAGLMRQRDAEFRVAAGQFFSKGVLDRLSSQRDLLEGRDAEVSILSCDIRGFSTIAHRVGPTETIKWINDVLTCLSQCVFNHDGVVVDYVGDALMAMFGAPEVQPDHADRAFAAACEMLRLVPALNERYRQLAEGKFAIGIGVNTGLARVGNTGSRLKFKYGPLGSTVNMASRIEGLTKHVGVPGLMTGATRAALTREVLSRRLSAVRVVGIPDPVQLFEIPADDSPARSELCARYEAALECYERQDAAEALSMLAAIVKQWPTDIPSQLLLKRSAACFSQTEPFDPVWTLEQK